MDIFKADEEIFNSLVKYIKDNDNKYEIKVARFLIKKKVPLVILEETKNQLNGATSNWGNQERLLNYNINIYAEAKNGYDPVTVARYIANLVSTLMEQKYKLRGGIVGNFANYDDRVETYRINMRYSGKYYPSNNLLF